MCYAIPDLEHRKRVLPWLMYVPLRDGDHSGEVWTTAALSGAAIWLPPGRTTLTLWRILRAGVLVVPLRVRWDILRRLTRTERMVASLHRQHAPATHWYLAQLGVDPARQGQGIGSALLHPMLIRLDTQGLACYLETMNVANVPFYQHHGFRVVAQASLPGTRLAVWAMLRSPPPHHSMPLAMSRDTLLKYSSGAQAYPAHAQSPTTHDHFHCGKRCVMKRACLS
jgi:GNAT superfamily N-acetyltransferase